MDTLKKILRLFLSGDKPSETKPLDAESKRNFDKKFDDIGIFTYEEDGFILTLNEKTQKIYWADIERIIAYKADLMTIDEIRMDIFLHDRQITINEDTPGWYQFVIKTKTVFPNIPPGWDIEIIQPAFATNLTIVYERQDRVMPLENNFYSVFRNIRKVNIKEILEQNGWTSRKSGRADFELRNNWSELVLTGDDTEALLNGIIAFHKDNIEKLEKVFEPFIGQYSYEFYDSQKQLILKKQNGR